MFPCRILAQSITSRSCEGKKKQKNNKYNEGLLPGCNKTSHSLRGNLGNGTQKRALRQEFAFRRDCHPPFFSSPSASGIISSVTNRVCVCVWIEDEEDEEDEDEEGGRGG